VSTDTPSMRPIGDLVEPVTSSDPQAVASAAHFRYVDLGSVDQEAKMITADRLVATEDAPSRARQIIHSGDILVSTVRPNLNAVAQVPPRLDRAIASTGFCVLRPRKDVLSHRYLFHWVCHTSFVSEMVRRAIGASYPAVSDRIVCESLIPLPPMDVQQHIAAILDKADELRQMRRAALERLDLLGRSVFYEMFGDPSTNKKKWRRHLLGALIVDGPQNGLYKPAECYGDGTPILRIDAFYDGEVTDYSSLRRLRLSASEIDLYRLNELDVVINRVNSLEYLGKSALIVNLKEDTVFESNMMRFQVDRRQVNPRYLMAFLQAPYIKAQILQRAKNAVNQSSINQDDVRSFTILTPPIDLQDKFAERASRIAFHSKSQGRAAAQWEDLFKSLQHRAFQGEL
jgi:type I restriction enzyme S subunit